MPKQFTINDTREIGTKRGVIILLLVLVAMQLLCFYPFLFNGARYLFTDIGSDTVTQQYPILLHKARHLAEGEGPLMWSFETGMGQNVYQGVTLDPVTLAGEYILSFYPVEERIIHLECFKILLAGLFFFLFLRLHRFSVLPSLVSAIAMAFSGYMIVGGSWFVHSTIIWQFCFFLWCVEGLLQKQWNRWLIPIAVLWIGVSPQLLFFSFFISSYLLFRLSSFGLLTFKQLWQSSWRLGGLMGIGVLLNGPALVSRIARFLDSPRFTESDAWSSLAQQSFYLFEPLANYRTMFLRTVSIDLVGTAANFQGWKNYLEAPLFYVGLAAIILLPLLFFQLLKRERISHLLFLGFWLVVAICTPLRHALYLFSGDYFKSALDLFIPTILLFYLAKLLHIALQKGLKNWLFVIPWGLGIAVLIFFSVNEGYGLSGPAIEASKISYELLYFPPLYLVVLATIALVLLSSALLIKQRTSLWGVLLVTVISVAELGYAAIYSLGHRDYLQQGRLDQKLAYNDYTIEALDFIRKQDREFYRIDKYYSSVPKIARSFNDGKAQGFYGTSSYLSFNQPHYLAFLEGTELISKQFPNDFRWASGLSKDPVLQTFAGVKYELHKTVDLKTNRGELIHKFGEVSVVKRPFVQPLGTARQQYLKRSQFNKLDKKQKALALLDVVVIPDSDLGKFPHLKPASKNARPDLNKNSWRKQYANFASLEIDSHSNKEISGEIELNAPSTLVFSIPYDMGWKAYRAGVAQPIEKVQLGFMGINLPKGKQTIRLVYQAPFFVWGIAGLIAGVMLYLLCLSRSVLRSRESLWKVPKQ